MPRVSANSLGEEFMQTHKPDSLRPTEARDFLSKLSDSDWERHVPKGANLAGSDLRNLWEVLSGSAGD